MWDVLTLLTRFGPKFNEIAAGQNCTDANMLNDFLTFISNSIPMSGKEIFGIWIPSKFNVPGWNRQSKELNARYREVVSHLNIAGRPRSG